MKDTLKANTYLFNVITPEEREDIENDQLPSYSRAFAQDARRSKCVAMLNNIKNPRSSCLY